jgi:hypothetical protein
VAQVVQGDVLEPGVGCGRVEAAPLDVAMAEPAPGTRGEHRPRLVGGAHLQLEQQPHELVGDRVV